MCTFVKQPFHPSAQPLLTVYQTSGSTPLCKYEQNTAAIFGCHHSHRYETSNYHLTSLAVSSCTYTDNRCQFLHAFLWFVK